MRTTMFLAVLLVCSAALVSGMTSHDYLLWHRRTHLHTWSPSATTMHAIHDYMYLHTGVLELGPAEQIFATMMPVIVRHHLLSQASQKLVPP